MTKYGDTPIDAKRFPAAVPVGIILMVLGMLIASYSLYSIIISVVGDEIHAFGLIGGLMIAPVGLLLMAVGGVLLFFGITGKLFSRNKGGLLY